MTKEDVLFIFTNKKPSAKSPYGLYGYPNMWLVASKNGVDVLARPGKTMIKNFYNGWEEVEGVHWQFMQNSTWIGQGYQGTFESLLEVIKK